MSDDERIANVAQWRLEEVEQAMAAAQEAVDQARDALYAREREWAELRAQRERLLMLIEAT